MADAKTTIALEVQAQEALKVYSSLIAAQRDLGKAIRQELGGAMPAASKGVDGLTASFKDFKREQVQEGRLVGFFVRELTEFAGVGKGAQEALGGVTQGVIGLATATGPLFAAWAGFEIFKAAAGYIHEAGKAADEESKRLIDRALEMRDAFSGLTRMMGDLAPQTTSASKFQRMAEMASSAASWDQEFAATGDITAKNTAAAQRAAFARMGGQQEMERLALVLAKENIEAARKAADEEKKAAAAAFERQVEDNKKREEEAKRSAEVLRKYKLDQARSLGLTDAMLGDEFAVGTDTRHPASQVALQAGKLSSEALSKYQKSWGEMTGPGNNAGEIKFMEQSSAEAQRLADYWMLVADSVGYAAQGFAQLGAAIGGAAGNMVAQMMEIVMAAIKMAVALAAASAAETPVVGWLMAAGAAVGLAATLVGVMGGIQARASGGPVTAGAPFLVGEKGPELFVPGANGAIAAAGTFGGGITVNISATDAASVERLFRDNSGPLVRVLRDERRAGRY